MHWESSLLILIKSLFPNPSYSNTSVLLRIHKLHSTVGLPQYASTSNSLTLVMRRRRHTEEGEKDRITKGSVGHGQGIELACILTLSLLHSLCTLSYREFTSCIKTLSISSQLIETGPKREDLQVFHRLTVLYRVQGTRWIGQVCAQGLL